MNPQGGEGNNNQLPTANTAAVVGPPLNATVESNVAASNPLDKLEDVVAAAKLEAGAVQPTTPIQALEETPKGQFENQFGSGPDTSPVAESAPGLIDTTLANLGSTPPPAGENVSANIQPALETPKHLEQTPADKLRQKISANIDAFLGEVEQKQGVTS